MTQQELRREIRDHKRQMKEQGVRVISCMNGGLDPITYRMNARLFELKVRLEQAQKQEPKNLTDLAELYERAATPKEGQ